MGKAYRRERLAIASSIALACALLTWLPRAWALDPSLDVSQYAHTAWRIRDGFSKGMVSSMAQTPDGYLWLGTEFGLLRFDGVRTVPWQPPEGQALPGSGIRVLLAARDGTLWIATEAGLASWKDGKLTAYPQLAGATVNALLEDREGTVWAGAYTLSAGRLCAIHVDRIDCAGDDGMFGRWVMSLLEDRLGRLWAAADNGLWRWKPGPPQAVSLPEPISANLQVLAEGDNDALLIATRSGIARLVDGQVDVLPLRDERKLQAARLLRDRHGGLWIGTTTGLLHLHQGRTDVIARSDGLSGDSVNKLFEDREGNVWVSTADGLDRFREFAAPRLSVDQGLTNGIVGAVLASRDGSLWLNTPVGLHRWHNGQMTFYRGLRDKAAAAVPAGSAKPSAREAVIDGVPARGIGSLFQDDRGRIWVGTLDGVGYLDNDRFVFVDGVPGGFIDSIVEDRLGNLWITHRDLGLFRLSAGHEVGRVPWNQLGRYGPASRLAVDPSQGGGLWIGFLTGGLAYVVDGQVRASYDAKDGLGKGRVHQLRVDQDGTLWVASEGGLSRVKNGRIATLTGKSGLPCDSVDWMIDDDLGSYWVHTACGLLRIARSELDAWAAAVDRGADAKRTIRGAVFDNSDGVRSGAISSYSPHVAKSADGKLWFAGADGVGVIDPRHLPHNALAPPVHVEQIVADRKPYDVAAAGPVRLPPLVRDLQIDYTALSLVAPEKVRFRTMLEGWDDDWVDVGNRRQAFYNDLPPGDYRFRVSASNNSGVWNEAGTSLAFSITPAFFQTAWFRVLVGAALLGAIWAAYQWRVRALASRLAEVQQEVRERVRAEEALRQSEERYALAVAGSNEGIFDWDLVHDRVYVAHRTQQLLGLQPGEPWRARKEWQRMVTLHPDDVSRQRSQLRAHLSGRTPACDVEFRLILPDGPRWFQLRGVALRDTSGKACRMAGSIADITDRKLEQEERLRLEGRLRQAQRFEAMGALAAGIAHDFNNILGAILGYGERALRGAGKGTRLQRDLDSVISASERGRSLVDRILSFSHASAGERVTVHVEGIVREALDLLQAKLPTGIVLSSSLRAGRAAFIGDPTQVHQVVMNLGTNAMHAMPAGGSLSVTLEVASFDAARPASIGTVTAGEYVVLEVADTGNGIAAEIMERIFDPFFTTKEAGAGTGLGLSLVLRIVTEAGGAIDVVSTVGAGSVFTVYLPRAGNAPEAAVDPKPPLPRGGGQRVLVVDDEQLLLTLVTETLDELGYSAIGFTSSVAALDAFRADPGKFDAMIVDGRMPTMPGSVLIREFRRIRQSIPILLLSGDMGALAAAPSEDGGPDAVLKKPLSARDLATCLARVLPPT